MKRKQYFISTRDGKIKVTGYPVVIPGYEEFEFFVHRPYLPYDKWEIEDRFGGDVTPRFWNKSWDISEAITGMKIMPPSYPGGMSDSTRNGALAIVIERFKSMEHEKASAILKAAIERAQA